MNRKLTVAITGLNATDNPGPGVAVARALRDAPEHIGRIVGLAYDSMEPGIYQAELVDDVFLIPYLSQGSEALLRHLEHVIAQTGVDVIIPTLDSELGNFIAVEPALRALGVGLFLPTAEQLELRSKPQLTRLSENSALPVPHTLILPDVGDVESIEAEVGYPVAMKGAFYGAEIATNVHEAIAAYHKLLAKWGGPIIAQRFIDGESELNVVAVRDGKGGLIGAVPMKKTVLTDKGKGWAGVAIRDEALMEITRQFMATTRWRGPCEIELIRSRTGENYIIEINPRFPAWCYLSAGAGMNLPLAVAQLASGEVVKPMSDYRAGTMFVRISLDQIVDLEDFGQLTSLGELSRWNHKAAKKAAS